MVRLSDPDISFCPIWLPSVLSLERYNQGSKIFYEIVSFGALGFLDSLAGTKNAKVHIGNHTPFYEQFARELLGRESEQNLVKNEEKQ